MVGPQCAQRRYDPITSTLSLPTHGGIEQNVRVGDAGRLRAVLEAGVLDEREAKQLGLPQVETLKGKGRSLLITDPGQAFNPLTHEYASPYASPRESLKVSGRKCMSLGSGTALTPRLNPLTSKLDPINSTRAALSAYDPRVLQPTSLRITPRPHVVTACNISSST